MSKLMTPELNVTRFANEDVIATSIFRVSRNSGADTYYTGMNASAGNNLSGGQVGQSFNNYYGYAGTSGQAYVYDNSNPQANESGYVTMETYLTSHDTDPATDYNQSFTTYAPSDVNGYYYVPYNQ